MLGRIIDLFLRGSLTPFIKVVATVVGLAAVVLTPREEEPQIVVPMADVFIAAPSLAVGAVERQVVTPLEKLLNQIDGVEDVYSASYAGRAVVTVRFFVGEDREDSLVKVYNKLYSNTDLVPADVTSWVVKPIEIDDVPIVNVTLWSDRPAEVDDFALRRIAEELEIKLKALSETNRTVIYGGRPRGAGRHRPGGAGGAADLGDGQDAVDSETLQPPREPLAPQPEACGKPGRAVPARPPLPQAQHHQAVNSCAT